MPSIQTLIQALQDPLAYPHEAPHVEVHQTHISVVFLAGRYAYKIKKPVDLGFVNYRTLPTRRHFCQREFELNRRLAPDVYLAVWAVIPRGDTFALVPPEEATEAEPVEWAVRMRRLDPAHTLGRRLARDRLPPKSLARIGHRLAEFHQNARRSEQIARAASKKAVAGHIRDNFSQTRNQIGSTVNPLVHARLRSCFDESIAQLAPLIDARAASQIPCDAHGDLRLEHIYIDDDQEIRVVDCVEFNESLRFADPLSDVAFLLMDLLIRGYKREAEELLEAYLRASDDAAGRPLLPLYIAYRSAVRAKVHGFKAGEDEVPSGERARAGTLAVRHWLFTLHTLAPASTRPRLLLIGGLPGTGKSTIARHLLSRGLLDRIIDSDAVRKELAGVAPEQSASDAVDRGIYTEAWTQQTYTTCTDRALEILRAGGRVAVDASFHSASRRRAFIDASLASGIPPLFLECRLPTDVAHQRLRHRHGDVSDAGVDVYEHMRARWEPCDAFSSRFHQTLDCRGTPSVVAQRAHELVSSAETSDFLRAP